MNATLYPLGLEDESFLWEMLFEAAHLAEEGETSVKAAINHSEIAKYVQNWGKTTDIGFGAIDLETHRKIGAAWMRLFPDIVLYRERVSKIMDIIDWQHPQVLCRSKNLAKGKDHPQEIIKTCFEWVRDEICHSSDYQMNPVTCRASDVLKFGTGYCYAKSHLLAALLRTHSIPTGLCYQRLSINDNGEPYCLHGLNAVYLPEIGWDRLDPRGNKLGINAQFSPPTEQLAFALNWEGEAEFTDIYDEPLPIVVQTLQSCQTWEEVLENLPDLNSLTDRC